MSEALISMSIPKSAVLIWGPALIRENMVIKITSYTKFRSVTYFYCIHESKYHGKTIHEWFRTLAFLQNLWIFRILKLQKQYPVVWRCTVKKVFLLIIYSQYIILESTFTKMDKSKRKSLFHLHAVESKVVFQFQSVE